MTAVQSHASFVEALRVYHKEESKQSTPKTLLVHQKGAWSRINTNPAPNNSTVLLETLKKILDLNIVDLAKDKAAFIHWIGNFNQTLSLVELNTKKIKPIEKTVQNVQFSSMSSSYGWLSNFFITLIYDPKYNVVYPSVENGYVAFKARKAKVSDSEITRYAHIFGSKDVKGAGQNLWSRKTAQDEQESIVEMERLVTLKFEQNPFIATWLKKSAENVQFEEFTSDPFWGSALGTTKDENSNHLGKIIQKTKTALAKKDAPQKKGK